MDVLEDRTLLSVVWDGGGTTNQWYEAANWSTDMRPGPGDDVVIPAGNSVYFHDPSSFGNIHEVASLVVEDTATLVVGSYQTGSSFDTLKVSETATIDGTLSIVQRARVGGIGEWTIHGTLNWIEGTVGTDADGVVNLYSDTLLNTSERKTTESGTIVNHGTLTWSNGLVNSQFDGGGTFVNAADGVMDLQVDDHLYFLTIVNQGLIRKSAGSGSTVIDNPFSTFTNDGTVRVESGILQITSSGLGNGTFDVQAGSELWFNSGTRTPHNYGPDSMFVGQVDESGALPSARIVITGVNYELPVNIAGSYDVPRTYIDGTGGLYFTGDGTGVAVHDLQMLGGRFGGTGVSNIFGDVDLRGGRFGTSGSPDVGGDIILHEDSTMQIRGTAQKQFGENNRGGSRIVNHGAVRWTEGPIFTYGGVFENHGTFLSHTDESLDFGDGTFSFINHGTFRKEANPDDSSRGVGVQAFGAECWDNYGTVEVAAGVIQHSTRFDFSVCVDRPAGAPLNAGFYMDPGSRLDLAGGDFLEQRVLRMAGGVLAGSGTLTGTVSQSGGTIAPGGDGPGQLVITGGLSQTDGTLAVQLGGPTLGTEFDSLHVGGNVSLNSDLEISLTSGFVPDNGQRFPVLTSGGVISGAFAGNNAADLGLLFQQGDSEVALLGQSQQPELTFDYGPVATVEVGEIHLHENPVANGPVADLKRVRVTLLPGTDGEPLATVLLNDVVGIDLDGNTSTVEGFLIDATVAIGDLTFDSPAGAKFELRDAAIHFEQFRGGFGQDLTGNIRLTSASPDVTLPPISGQFPGRFRIFDDDATSQPALSGSLDFASGQFELTTDRFEGQIGDGFTLEGSNATLSLGQQTSPASLFSAGQLTLGLNLPGRPGVSVTAADLEVSSSGEVSVATVDFEPQQPITEQTIAGVLPFQVTRVEIAPISGTRVSLRDFDASVTVEGYFDDSKFAGLPFVPRIQVGGVEQPTGEAGRIDMTYRLVDGILQPWDFGPVSLGINGILTDGLTFDGEITLGGYELGRWNPGLSGFFSVVDTDDSDPALSPFRGTRFDILPQGSTLSAGNDLFSDGASLRVMSEVTLDRNFTGMVGGLSVAGLTVGLQFRIDATVLEDAPFVQFDSSATLGELSVREVVIDVEHLARVTTSAILFDFTPDSGAPIGRVGRIDIEPHDNALFSGLSQSRVEIFDALMFEDRLELGHVRAVLQGLITGAGGGGEVRDLLLVDELEVEFQGTTIAADFGQFTDRDFVPSVPFVTAGVEGITVSLQSGIVAPDTANIDEVPDVECVNGLPTSTLPQVSGFASVACLNGSFDGTTGRVELNVGQMSGRLPGNLEFDTTDARVVLGAGVAAPLLQVDTATLSLPIQDERLLQLSVTDLQVSRDGEVSFQSARAVANVNALGNVHIERFLPVSIDLVEITPATGDRVYLNRDADGNGVHDPFDIRVVGEFNTTPFSDFGLDATARVGSRTDNVLDATFRLRQLADGTSVVQPWNTGDIKLALARVDAESTLNFDGEIVLGGYTDGVWIPNLTGVIDASASITTDDGQQLAGLQLEFLDGSFLTDGNLTLNTVIRFSAGTQGQYLGLDLDGLQAGFRMSLDFGYTNQAPGIYFTDFAITPGEVAVAQLELDIQNFVTLTLNDITIHPGAEPFATVLSIEADFSNNALLDELAIVTIDVQDTAVYSDRVVLGQVSIFVDGTFGQTTDLLEVDDLEIRFTNVEIAGSFTRATLNQSVSVTTSLQGIDFSAPRAVLLPDSDVSASAIGIAGGIDIPTGTVTLSADRIEGEIYDVVTFSADTVSMLFGPNVAPSTPFLEVAGATTLGVSLFDQPVTLSVDDLQVARDGAVSIQSAAVSSQNGIGRGLGLAEGLLPFDVTLVEMSAPAGRLRLNDPSPDLAVSVEGFFDFEMFEDLPFTPVLTMGQQSADPGTPRTDDNVFHLAFSLSDHDNNSSTPPEMRIEDTGELTLGLRDFGVGPFRLDVATLTLGGYEDGQWTGSFGADLGMSWDGIGGDGQGNNPFEIDAAGGLSWTGQLSRQPNSNRTMIDSTVTFDADLGLGNLPLQGDAGGAWGFRVNDLRLKFAVEFMVVFDASGFRLQRVQGRSPVRLQGVSVGNVETSFAGLVHMQSVNASLNLDAFTTDAQGRVVSTGPFLTFGGERPDGPVRNQADLESVDGSIEVTVGYDGLGIGGRAGNFGIGWSPFNTDPGDAENFSLGVTFHQLPGFFVALARPESADGAPDFSFGLEWIGVEINEIGLRFEDVLNPDELAEPLTELLPTGPNASREPGSGVFETATSFGMNLLRNVNLLFSGGVDTGVSGVIGDLIDVRAVVDDAEVNIDALRACAQYVWDNRDSLGVTALVEDAAGGQIPGGSLMAMAQLPELFRDGSCDLPITGIDAVDGGLDGIKLGPLKLGGGLGFGRLDFDRDGDGAEDSTVSFFRGQLDAAFNDIGFGVEVVLTEYGPVMGRIMAGVPIPIGTMIGALAGSVVPGPGTLLGSAAGMASGFILTGTEGGLVFDGEPLPVIVDPTELVTNVQLQAPTDFGLNAIREATERLFRNGDGSVRQEPRTSWDNGFSVIVSGTLTNLNILTAVGLDITIGLNVGYDLPDYKLADGRPLASEIVAGTVSTDLLGGSLGSLAGVDPDILADTLTDGVWSAAEQTLIAGMLTVPYDVEPVDFANAFPFGFQLYGLGDLEVLGFEVGGVGAMLDFRDPLNPALDMAAQLPKEGTLLGTLFPARGEIGLRLDSEGLVEGSIIAAQTLFELVFDAGVDVGQDFFDDVLQTMLARLNADLVASEADPFRTGRTLTQFVREALNPSGEISLEQFRDWLLGGNGQPGVLNFDFSVPAGGDPRARIPDLSDSFVQQAALLTGELMRELLLAAPLVADHFEGYADDALLQRLMDAVVPTFDQQIAALPGTLSGDELTRFEQAIADPPTYRPTLLGDPAVYFAAQHHHRLVVARQRAIGGLKAQTAVMGAIAQVLWPAIEGTPGVAEVFFETINPSLTIDGAIEPVLLGVPVGDPAVSASVHINKRGVHVEGKGFRFVELLMTLAGGLRLPIYDELDLGVSIPFENLYRDLYFTRGIFPPEIDTSRAWLGTFQGTAGLGLGAGAGFDIGDITGLVFPAVETPFDPEKPLQGLPENHPLATHVRIIDDESAADGVSRPVWGPEGHVSERIFVTLSDFITMREHGGLLLDGRLTVPQFITDPVAWYTTLREQTSEDLDFCQTYDTLLACFQGLSSPEEYFEFFQSLAAAGISIDNALNQRHQLAQVQAFVPNVADELSDMLGSRGREFKDDITAVFDTISDGEGTLRSDLEDLLSRFQSNNIDELEATFSALIDTLVSAAYLRGQVGTVPPADLTSLDTSDGSQFLPTTGSIFGVDIGGARMQWDDGVLSAVALFGETGDLQSEFLLDPELGPSGQRGIPGAGVSFSFGGADGEDPSLLAALLTRLQTGDPPADGSTVTAPELISSFARAGEMLLDGVQLNDLDVMFHAYTPGFAPASTHPDALVRDLQREGGLAMQASVELSNAFGTISGDAEFSVRPDADSPLGVAFSGSFRGSGVLDIINPITGVSFFGVTLPTLEGRITPSGCVELTVEHASGTTVGMQFSLAPGACNGQITLTDLTVAEPSGNSQTVVNVPVRLEQIPLRWTTGELALTFELSGSAEFGQDYLFSGVNGSARIGELVFTPAEIVDNGGERYAEKFIPITLLGDGSQASSEDSVVRVDFEFFIKANGTGETFQLPDRESRLTILDTDFVIPPRPVAPSLLYAFESNTSPHPGGFWLGPDASSTLDYASFANPGFGFSSQGILDDSSNAQGLPRLADQTGVGRAFAYDVPNAALPDESGLLPGFEFHAEVSSLFTPDRIEFWDRPRQALAGTSQGLSLIQSDEWEVYAMVGGNDPVPLPVTEIVTVTPATAPNSHPDLYGWRMLRVDIGNRLREPVPLQNPDSFVGQPWPYFSGPRDITFRLVPVVAGAAQTPFGTRVVTVDDVALYGGARTMGGNFGGRQLSFDEFVNGRIQFEVEGPGVLDIVFEEPAPGTVDPVPFDDLRANIRIVGADETSTVRVSVSGRDADAGPLDLGLVRSDFPIGMLDLSAAGAVRGVFELTQGLSTLHVDSLAGGTSFEIGGTASDQLTLLADGAIGDGSNAGVVLTFPGELNGEVGAFDGGTIDAGSIGDLVTGPFSATVQLIDGFGSLTTRGDLLSPLIETGRGSAADGGSGTITVLDGSFSVNDLTIRGSLGGIDVTGGGVYVNLSAANVGSVRTRSTPASGRSDIRGTLTVGSLDALETAGGDLEATVVTSDAVHSSLVMTARPDAQGRGGRIISENSLHIAGGVSLLSAEVISVNLIAGGVVEQIVAGGEAPGTLTGHLRAGRFGRVAVTGTARFSLHSTAATSAQTPAIGEIVVQGDWLGGSINTQAGLDVGSIQIRGGQVLGLLRVDASLLDELVIDTVSSLVEILGDLGRGEFGTVDARIVIGGRVLNSVTADVISDPSFLIELGVRGGPDDEFAGIIEGRSFLDANGNGSRDSGEPWNSGRRIQLVTESGEVIAETVTHDRDLNRDGLIDPVGEAGWFTFRNVPPGDYLVREELDSDWVPTFPVGGEHAVHAEAGNQTSAVDFGSRQAAPAEGIRLVDRTLHVAGTDKRDRLVIRQSAGRIIAHAWMELSRGRYLRHQRLVFSRADVDAIEVVARAGRDSVSVGVSKRIRVRVLAGEGNDTIRTGAGPDTVIAGPGNDWIRTFGGADEVDAGDGDNTVYTGSGKDRITTGNGNNLVASGDAADVIQTGDGNDLLLGGSGNDRIFSGGGNDTVSGGRGNDLLVGGRGRDYLFGDDDQDILIGGEDADYLHGGRGSDLLVGGVTSDDVEDLDAVFAIWTSGTSYASRHSRLTSDWLSAGSVFDDGVSDRMLGAAGRDWFIGRASGRSRDQVSARDNEWFDSV